MNSPAGSPFVEIPGYVSETEPPQWGARAEWSVLLVLEAQRRFLVATQDPRLAATLTLAWATMIAANE